MGQETRCTLVGSLKILKVSDKDTIGVPAGAAVFLRLDWRGSASQLTHVAVDRP